MPVDTTVLDYTPVDGEQLLRLYMDFRARYDERTTRHDVIDAILQKNWGLEDDAGDPITVKTPNFADIALSDIAEAASALPTIRVRPIEIDDDKTVLATTMARAGRSQFEANVMELLVKRIIYDVGAYGLSAIMVEPDYDTGEINYTRRDPRSCYPEPGIRPGDLPKRVVMATLAQYTSLPDEWQEEILTEYNARGYALTEPDKVKAIIVEYVDNTEYTTGVLVGTGKVDKQRPEVSWVPVVVESVPVLIGHCPVYVFDRLTFDGAHRGLADDVVETMLAHAELIGLVIEYADQAVYSDIWARDVIGEVPMGGQGLIKLGPNGQIGRIPPASMSLDLWRSVDALEQLIHLGLRWPKTRTGEIEQAIASGKFVESTVAMLNTVIRNMHQTLQRGLAALLRVGLALDKAHFGGETKTATGVLRNQEFIERYDPGTFDLASMIISVEYGLGLGKSVEQAAIIMQQYSRDEMISRAFVQENIEGITDVGLERERIDLERFEKMMNARILQAIEAGELPPHKIAEAYRERAAGRTWVEVFEQLFPEPEDQLTPDDLAALGIPSIGSPPGELPAPPPPPDVVQGLSRITAPAGPGGTIGTQIQG